VLEGVFERYPKLKMVMIEAGFGWAPSLAWRWTEFRAAATAKCVSQAKPSEYISDQSGGPRSRWRPECRDHLLELIEWIGWDKLLFATDYPHWDYDDPSRVMPAGVSDANAKRFISAMRRSLRARLMARHVVAPVDELPPGTRKFLVIDERPIAISTSGEFSAS